jgi:hypothetical protein
LDAVAGVVDDVAAGGIGCVCGVGVGVDVDVDAAFINAATSIFTG